MEAASAIFVVVNHELPTVRSAHRLVSMLRQRYGAERVSVIVNRADRHSEISLEDIKKAIGAPIKHVFPNDYRQAVSAANKGEPIASSTQGRLAQSFHELARVFVGQASEAALPAEDSSRLFGWLTPRKSVSG